MRCSTFTAGMQSRSCSSCPSPIGVSFLLCATGDISTLRRQCRRVAVEKDDLSLLANMTRKERQKLNDKGIFTVTQLSYTFRPRRRRGFKGSQAFKHEPALKALAIRKDRIHVVGTPTFNIPECTVYLDVEGIPDRDF